MNFDFTGALDDGEFAMEPVIEEGWATVMEVGPNVIIEGTLVDSPEGTAGVTCVVLDTPLGIRAFISSTLGPLAIENAPCVLEFRAVLRQTSEGGDRWDWEVHEISPNGGRLLVSQVPDATHRS